ncbi:hypothetical protein F751_5709 [Auxenochlorella protothecoides]|uniref:Expansin-like EG45 domain-containing protein n=1 Tax=Auxenochlorella protothecoides TaxID=3075 RepID=A0A087SRX8_AUXPR|nr:hypothetical protein F751_5709 [Auxenochlorella protothecoides]KFM28482.1 hypothetical protein F751_5709 [Auxenochlorella protothecoides]
MRSAWTQALLLLAGTAWAVSAANTPGRQVTIAGMRLNTYFPMSTLIGSWPLQAGDNLVCELWECDGGVGGCDPAKPSLLPNATAGDDRLGELTLGMDDYAAQLTLTSSFNTSATNAAAGVMLECDECWQLWRDNNGAWVLAPVPSPPAPQEVTSFDGPDESPSPVEQSPATAESPAPADAPVKGGGLATGVIAAIGAVVGLLALLAIGTTIYCARRGKCCFGRGKVSPETAPSDAEAQAEDPALHVNVRKPKHALPLMRAANASAATVTTPWAPDLLEGRSDP